MRSSAFILILIGLAVPVVEAQRLASYDYQSLNHELAARRCPPKTPRPITDDLDPPGMGPANWWEGAIAVAHQARLLYWSNGPAAQGIQVDAENSPVSTFPVPAGFARVNGMVVDPTDTSGRSLYVTDGLSLVRYRAPGPGQPAAIVGGPWAWPFSGLGGVRLTGLTYDPFDDEIVAVDDTGWTWDFDISTSTFVARSILSAFATSYDMVTGIQMCLVSGDLFITEHDGDVWNISSGGTVTFPPAPGGGVRHHQGLTFTGEPVNLGGESSCGPIVKPHGWAYEQNSGFGLDIDPKLTGNHWLLIDFAALEVPFVTPFGTLHVDPVTAMIIDLGSHDQPFLVPLPLPTGSLGASAVVQFIAVRPDASVGLSDAYWIHIYRAY